MVLVKSLATPIVWVLMLLVIGLVASRLKRRERIAKVGWWVVLAGALLLGTLSLEPVSRVLAYSLECRYVPASGDVLQTLDIVVVLGGGKEPAGWLRPEAEPAGATYARVCQGVKLFEQSSARLLAFCGGRPWPGAASGAELMKAVAVETGVAEDLILTESESHNTQENAVRLVALLPPGRQRRIGLVTSATHMLRSERVFRRQFPEDTIIPLPVNYKCGPVVPQAKTLIPAAAHLRDSTGAIHEWIGLLWYALRYR